MLKRVNEACQMVKGAIETYHTKRPDLVLKDKAPDEVHRALFGKEDYLIYRVLGSIYLKPNSRRLY